MNTWLRSIVQRVLPPATRRLAVRYTRWPPVNFINFGSLRRLKPISDDWGTERGKPIDRYYIEQFLAAYAPDIRGVVLEIGDDTYTRMFGADRVIRSEVLHVSEKRPKVSILADLTNADHISSNFFDCIILTQTLQFIYDVSSVVSTINRILKPGGVVLATFPGISKISRYDMDRWGHYWSFTTKSASMLFSSAFPKANIETKAYGNVLVATAFLHGVASEELRQDELGHNDPNYQLLIAVRAMKPQAKS